MMIEIVVERDSYGRPCPVYVDTDEMDDEIYAEWWDLRKEIDIITAHRKTPEQRAKCEAIGKYTSADLSKAQSKMRKLLNSV